METRSSTSIYRLLRSCQAIDVLVLQVDLATLSSFEDTSHVQLSGQLPLISADNHVTFPVLVNLWSLADLGRGLGQITRDCSP